MRTGASRVTLPSPLRWAFSAFGLLKGEEDLILTRPRIESLKTSLVNGVTLALIPVLALALVFLPVDRVLASPPNFSLTTCSAAQPQNSSDPCTFAANYYAGAGSLTYCFLGEGALYLRGVYYPLTQPGASPARDVSNAFCPAMHR